MPRKARVSLKFIKDPVADKTNLGESVYEKMQSSGYFQSPPVDYSQMEQINKTLHDAAQHAKNGGIENYRKQDVAEKKWDDMMRNQARYVTLVANGDPLKIAGSGFHSTITEPQPWHEPKMTSAPEVTYNNRTGGIDIKVEKVKFATVFNYILVSEPERIKLKDGRIVVAPGTTPVYHICDTHRKINVKYLTGGMAYYLFVFPAGPAGMGASPTALPITFPHPLVGKQKQEQQN